ncbi:histidinol-phosphate aminotransferase family protein [Romboutsia maritimum]|uniref:Histidinol-phosphate aminotransferase family protein n=1 Tax=Romboutsia maritimum TaxID=2020948 RepID=A0A371IVK8_9FIRM|nr:histidinol-phosphate transaminase [Romboutsia maritimum]RDY24523.1 histidinol-phosphate aminotransferase family protein [Romboutsia maritimum]
MDDAIRLAFEVFGQLDKKIISVNPSFEMYSVYSKMYGMHHVPIHFNEKFEVDIEEIIDSIDKNTGIVSLLNPNSPIGKSWNENQIIRIIEKAKENQAVIIIDEVYYYFNPISFLDLIYEYDKLMIFRTFTKLLSIAGGRIGYIVSNYKMIDMLKRASGTYPVNCFAIKFAEKLLENPSIIENLIKIEKEGREFLISKLKTNNYDYYCNGGNYILIRSNKMPKELFDMLKERKILIKTYNNPILVDWIRITTGGIESMKLFWNEFEKLDLL